MEFEVTLRIKVDDSTFYWDASISDRTESVSEMVRNAMYDLDEVKIKEMEVESLD
jgi:hypothetical protein